MNLGRDANRFNSLWIDDGGIDVNGNVKADSFLIDDGQAIKTDVVSEPTGSDQVINVVSLTQAEFDAITPNATTLYIIED